MIALYFDFFTVTSYAAKSESTLIHATLFLTTMIIIAMFDTLYY